MTDPTYHTLKDGSTLAYHKFSPDAPADTPGIIFLGGYASDMTGSKATFMESYCKERNIPFIRFDYQGHGQSSGRFEDGTIGLWAADAIAILDEVADKNRQHILIGSSMGGWIMLLTALARPERVAGLLGIAPAADFSEDLIWNQLTPTEQEAFLLQGIYTLPGDSCPDPARPDILHMDDPFNVHLNFIEEARNHLLLRDTIGITCPVRLLHGMADADVPYQTSLKLAEKLAREDVTVTLLKDGGHRMSTPEQLEALQREVEVLLSSFLSP